MSNMLYTVHNTKCKSSRSEYSLKPIYFIYLGLPSTTGLTHQATHPDKQLLWAYLDEIGLSADQHDNSEEEYSKRANDCQQKYLC